MAPCQPVLLYTVPWTQHCVLKCNSTDTCQYHHRTDLRSGRNIYICSEVCCCFSSLFFPECSSLGRCFWLYQVCSIILFIWSKWNDNVWCFLTCWRVQSAMTVMQWSPYKSFQTEVCSWRLFCLCLYNVELFTYLLDSNSPESLLNLFICKVSLYKHGSAYQEI